MKVVVTKYYKQVGRLQKPPKVTKIIIKKNRDWKSIVDTTYERLKEPEVNSITLHFTKG